MLVHHRYFFLLFPPIVFRPWLFNFIQERISTECCKTKATVITIASLKKRKYPIKAKIIQNKTSKLPQARENACDQVVFGFSFESDWLRKWREFSESNTAWRKSKPKLSRINFDTRMKIALTFSGHCQMKVSCLRTLCNDWNYSSNLNTSSPTY